MKSDSAAKTEKPSKSARKRAAQQVRKLADELVAMKASLLARLPLPDDIRTQVDEARQMASHGALRRQKQYIARLLRDQDLTEIVGAIEQRDDQSRETRQRFHQAERWRDSMLRRPELPKGIERALTGEVLETAKGIVASYHATRVDAERKKYSRTLFRVLHEALVITGEDRHER
ncbi:MAG: ribosome biogenesis factor YjgA [Pseudomonadota bacterium]